MKYIYLIIIFISASYSEMTAQKFWDRLATWEEKMTHDHGTVNIDVAMIDVADSVTVLDKSTMQIVQDQSGYYAKMFDFEFFSEGQLGLSVDHQEQKILITSIENAQMEKQKLLQTEIISSMKKYITIEQVNSSNGPHYQLIDTESQRLLLELQFDDLDRISWMRQHVDQRVEIDGRWKNVLVDLAYSYQSDATKPAVESYIQKDHNAWVSAPQYKSYHLLQH